MFSFGVLLAQLITSEYPRLDTRKEQVCTFIFENVREKADLEPVVQTVRPNSCNFCGFGGRGTGGVSPAVLAVNGATPCQDVVLLLMHLLR